MLRWLSSYDVGRSSWCAPGEQTAPSESIDSVMSMVSFLNLFCPILLCLVIGLPVNVVPRKERGISYGANG